jgi:hypothetical protein
MSGEQMHKHAPRRYIVFRIKAMEFMDLLTLVLYTINRGSRPPRAEEYTLRRITVNNVDVEIWV